MNTEALESSAVVQRQTTYIEPLLGGLIAELNRLRPQLIMTCARGSSAHAATFAKHLFERHLGVPVAEAAPSITTIYRNRLNLKHQLFLAISQSGLSDDLVECALEAKAAGALTAAIVNDTDSPLAAAVDAVLPMGAGRELSIAATKTFIASLAVLLRLTASWTGSRDLSGALDRLPTRLTRSAALDWTRAAPELASADSLITLGRGPTLCIAQEAALKLKEVCRMHAEAYSSAEFQHGPIALVDINYPVFIFAPGDEAAAGISELGMDLTQKGSAVFMTTNEPGNFHTLPIIVPERSETDAICLVQAFYRLAIHLAQRRGTDIDQPPHLQKVTRTR